MSRRRTLEKRMRRARCYFTRLAGPAFWLEGFQVRCERLAVSKERVLTVNGEPISRPRKS
jgi:hypothetical protein